MFLVTGATGFIGSHLVEKLCASGASVRAMVRRIDREWPCSVARCDLVDGAGLEAALDGVDTVIHLAGATKALTNADYFRANAEATATLARALRGRPVRLVHVSSLAAAGPSTDGVPLSEEVPPHPVSQYGRSKLEGERLAREIKPDTVIVRPPVVYGPGDREVFRILKSVAQGWMVEMGGGERWFSAIYVGDLVAGLIRAATHAAASGRTYFMAFGKPNTWSSLASTAARIMGVKTRALRVPLPAAYAVGCCAEMWGRVTRRPSMISRDKIAEARCTHWVCDSRRAASELGWEAVTPIEAGLAQALAWYKEAGWIQY